MFQIEQCSVSNGQMGIRINSQWDPEKYQLCGNVERPSRQWELRNGHLIPAK